MIDNNIHQLHTFKQDSKDGIFTMNGISIIRLIHTLIREYGTYENGTMTIDPNNLSIPDMRLVLSHILDSGDYEWACHNNERTQMMFQEHMEYIQTILDEECYTVYCENMEENGMRYVHDINNDEVYWMAR